MMGRIRLWPIILLLAAFLPASAAWAADDTGAELSPRYVQAAEGCARGNQNNCLTALINYARDVSNEDLGPVIAMLRQHCTAEVVTACSALADAYKPFSNSSVEGSIQVGINDPVRRREALNMGCGAVIATYNTCGRLADLLAEAGDRAGASAAHERACRYARSLADADRIYLSDWDCYNAAKYALAETRDYAVAQREFTIVCSGDTAGLAPYGCKYLGRIYEGGLGVPADPDAARDYYAQSCFHPRAADADGEGCLLYGKRLIADRQRPALRSGDVAESAGPGTPIAQAALEQASRAFQRGCATDIPLACEANEALLQRQLAGELGYQIARCFVRAPGGPATTARQCRAITRFPNHEGRTEDADSLSETIYVWPDQERTVLRQDGGRWLINGHAAEGPARSAGFNCFTNVTTNRQFCVESVAG
ncbi:SEL1-like repeat protein [Croceibacterium xixiisoli]|nr:hypothetical protein [Croceibacterium xixiisoli]